MKNIDNECLRRIIAETIAEFERTPFVPILVSNRHAHLSAGDVEALFGTGYRLTYIKELLPGQFACRETVNISGAKGTLENVRILAPPRNKTQVELSLTDSFKLGISLPVNESGNLAGAGLVTIINPLNSSSIERQCAIVAKRHIHLSPAFAKKYALRDRQSVSVEINSPRGTILKDVFLRVSKDFRDEMHIDTDEANAGLIKNGDIGRILV